jgi:lipopolysaccharide/colanic/teichoic acid biosynthesis glycosyltransferase
MYKKYGKRIFDLVVTIPVLFILSPLFLLVALLIHFDSPGSIFHRTKRLARGGGEYTLLKFRTMEPDAEKRLQDLLAKDPAIREEYYQTYKIRNDPRITRIGRFLRRWSLDEIPQFINIFSGDMSLVGPRQILSSELWKYGDNGSKLITVTPGVTGLWQISGRSSLSYEQRVELDMYYIDHLSFWLDLKILSKTPAAIIRGEGAL